MVFYIYFYTHKTDDSNDASTSFFLLFSLLLVFLRLLLHWVFSRFTRWLDEWTSLFLLHWDFSRFTRREFLLSFSSALTFLRTFRWIFREERLARKDTRKIEIGSCEIRILNPHHFLPLEKFPPVSGIEPGSALPIMSLMHLLQRALMQTWKLDNSSSRWGV